MPSLSAAVSFALSLANVPTAPLRAVQEAPAPTTSPTTSPTTAPRTWRCGDNQAKYRPAEAAAQQYWRERSKEFVKASSDRRLEILEAAWTDTRDACFLYFLYRANELQGHFIKAYEQAQVLQTVGPGIPADAADYVDQVREGAKDCDLELRLDEVAAPAQAEVQATYNGLAEGDDLTGRCTLTPCAQTFAVTDRPIKQAVRVGVWTLVAGAGTEFSADSAGPGDPADRRTVVIDHCGTPKSLTIIKKVETPITAPPITAPPVVGPPVTTPPIETPPKPVGDMRRLSNVGVGVGAGLVLAGGVLLGVGASRWSSVYGASLERECNAGDANGTDRCRGLLAGPTQLRAVGAGVFAAGAGLLIPAMALRRTVPTQRAVWLPVVGGLATAAGVALVVVGATGFNRDYGADSTTPWAARTAGSMAVHTVGGALTGFGMAMLGASLARCMWRGACKSGQRPERTLQVAPGRVPGGAGLTVAGRF